MDPPRPSNSTGPESEVLGRSRECSWTVQNEIGDDRRRCMKDSQFCRNKSLINGYVSCNKDNRDNEAKVL